MPNPVPETVQPENLGTGNPRLDGWARSLLQLLVRTFQQIGYRLNGSIHKDGEIAMEAPFKLAEYTVATVPDAADFERGIIYVVDGAAGEKFRGSDGTTWVNLG